MANPYQVLPAVHQMLAWISDVAAAHAVKVAASRRVLEQARQYIQQQQSAPDEETLRQWLYHEVAQQQQLSLRPVINATGVIIHTNLGRAPLSIESIKAVQSVAQGYSNLEYDLDAGKRGQRQNHIESLITEITGAEASVVVNNNAAAVFLVLNALCRNREVIISRGQLVEIGGGFRIPDVMRQGGAKLVEVGTTNRTRATDYEHAITDDTAALIRVHSSNFRQIGFTQEVSLDDMVTVAHQHNTIVIDDLGSGTLIDTTRFGLVYEPTVQTSVNAGVDLTLFSGDKLLGGPQAGIIIGRTELVRQLKYFPLMRSLRPDKTTIAALACTLMHYRNEEALVKIPVWQMISMPLDAINRRAEHWQKQLGGEIIDAESTVGGGSLPGDTLPTRALALNPQNPDNFLAHLRQMTPPVIARIQQDCVLLDPRTVFQEQDSALMQAVIEAQRQSWL